MDGALGTFIESLPAEVRDNSVFVFTSDHGEYASSHGLQGKGGTIYEEDILAPLVAGVGQYVGLGEGSGSDQSLLLHLRFISRSVKT